MYQWFVVALALSGRDVAIGSSVHAIKYICQYCMKSLRPSKLAYLLHDECAWEYLHHCHLMAVMAPLLMYLLKRWVMCVVSVPVVETHNYPLPAQAIPPGASHLLWGCHSNHCTHHQHHLVDSKSAVIHEKIIYRFDDIWHHLPSEVSPSVTLHLLWCVFIGWPHLGASGGWGPSFEPFGWPCKWDMAATWIKLKISEKGWK